MTCLMIFLWIIFFDEINDRAVCMFLKKWSSLSSKQISDECCVKYQVVLPRKYRGNILEMAHNISFSGHVGKQKPEFWNIFIGQPLVLMYLLFAKLVKFVS